LSRRAGESQQAFAEDCLGAAGLLAVEETYDQAEGQHAVLGRQVGDGEPLVAVQAIRRLSRAGAIGGFGTMKEIIVPP
jgi:hypothetical protein